MPHLEIQLRLSEPKGPQVDEEPDPNPMGAGWILGVKFWDDHTTEMLTAEPVDIRSVVRVAKAVKMRGKHEGNLMPWVETLTVRLLDAIEEVIRRHELAIERQRQALDPLSKIHSHALGDEAIRHPEVDQAAAMAQKRARQQRLIIEDNLRADMEEAVA